MAHERERELLARRKLIALFGFGTGMLLLRPSALFSQATLSAPGPVEPQPYFAGVRRALEALAKLGAPIAATDAQQLTDLSRRSDLSAVDAAERILDRYTLARVVAEADGYARTTVGGAPKELIEQGWRLFLVRVSNSISTSAKLNIADGTRPLTTRSTGAARAGVPDTLNMAPFIARTWIKGEMYDGPPMQTFLSGSALEYQIVQLYSRDHGKHEADINFFTSTEQDAQYLAGQYRRGVHLNFDCLPSRDVTLHVHDVDGRSCIASLTIKDEFNRVYPLQAMRLAPDMAFLPQIYRGDGESVRLPDGRYTIESGRGPEYLYSTQTVEIGNAQNQIEIQLARWIDPAQWGWYSGDTHIHAAGCAHYEHPTEGVSPETMIRFVRGEALSIGDVLTWGPDWYYQKQFFSGHADSPRATLEHPELQFANNITWQVHPTLKDSDSLLRYDVEVSGFPSSHCGHLVLLRLKGQDYPGTKIIEDWPSWNLPILQWAKLQGAVAGYAHCGLGMMVDSTELPNYEIPPMDSIGTQEAIVDVTHGPGLVNFLSGCDTLPVAELNAWYHMLNCGFRMALIGETDFPCLSDERVGRGRSYVRLDHRPLDDAGYDAWISNLQKGKLYCGDGRSHFLRFEVNDRPSGEDDIALNAPGLVNVEALVAARLEPEPTNAAELAWVEKGWNLEHARIERSRNVAVELVVNGFVVKKTSLVADGQPNPIKFTIPIARSSWIALRILPSSHTHPVFVQLDGRPIRASERSAQWCRDCVDKLWEVKAPLMREKERPAAEEAFDHARETYDAIIGECEVA